MHWFSEFNNFTAYISDIVWGVDNISSLWDWADIFIGLMVFANLIALIALRNEVKTISQP